MFARRFLAASSVMQRQFVRSISKSVRLHQLDLKGIYPPICTPFTDDGKFDINYEKLAENMKVYQQSPLRGYLVQGSNGEYIYLTPSERVELVRRVRPLVTDGRLLLAGSGCESTAETVELSQQMAEAGADALVVVTPCYYKASMNDAAMVAHYTAVADASPVPVILYSVPANTGINLSVEAVTQLAPHPNIIGIKDSLGDISKLAQLVETTKDEQFQVLAGSAGFLLPALLVGCVGGICALANVVPEAVCRLESLWRSGSLTEAAKLQRKLVAPNAAVTRGLGVPGMKAAMDAHGLYGGPLRPPLLPLSDAQKVVLHKIFVDAEL
ncbi:4-hydroxy-2-oxoglutarate aldolase, mitochondrial-like isoform X2 [Amphibalanus amphitrite]|uniref:4-hydroxy-2-oxoglutarate aldolase, mitochondrial-like isoform X2 n=1 Tax=Amphibalanus amphitrite TaxID=1232801 RepID=UPI001C913820|nr:4-hydroxy-2-oxoglutarate aldolase, mitochondrial-like isoform X2 [Amphibalanus amphitrite]XP_043234349.1 4-hydroxy-2-oxoglutarate aldolase, mitochondrial-like isoform X2 [Amphibalanus amphitrite]XP_043234350.1 4-hydroxy-2-oxoglutarate aldolase, mitochondrial-like isoform X2 [Amphibalanus amphitrite]XP_043234351.1 4-hydroxy-2-oxoglutarate aldolase, mitochondrial-like isoform X2 [Amphibalanus amphitrite]XP_043234352.1 4-hydroxy-2-oxoglutarate aldolase, mitochondrial-like isoform X2 [Amphibalan